MNLFELRQHVEQAIPVWVYFTFLGTVALIAFLCGFFGIGG